MFHNLSGYDSHLFVKNLGVSHGSIDCIPNNEERYISFTKKIQVGSYTKKVKNNQGETEEKTTPLHHQIRLVVYKGGDWLNSFNAKLLRRSLSSRLTLSLLPPPYIRSHTSYSYYPLSILPDHSLTHSFILLPYPYPYPCRVLCCAPVSFVSYASVSFVSCASVLCVRLLCVVCVCISCASILLVSSVLLVLPILPPEQFTHSNYSSYSTHSNYLTHSDYSSYSSCSSCSSCLSCSSCSSCSAPPITPLPLSNSLNSIFVTHQLI